MERIAVVTDSNSGITQKLARLLGVYVLPMSFNIDGEQYFEGLSISHSEFYEKQKNGAKIFTSQPAVGEVIDLWEKVFESYDSIIYIPMASALSSSYATANMLANDYEGRVHVIDNQRVAVSQKQAVLDALSMVKAGMSAVDIRNKLFYTRSDASIYMVVDDMKYLKAGGRISGATAAIGTVLNIKPVLAVNDGVIQAVAKPRGIKAAKKQVFASLEADMENKFHSTDINDYRIYTAAALKSEDAKEWNREVEEYFGKKSHIDAIPLSVSAHVGIGTFGACLCKRIDI